MQTERGGNKIKALSAQEILPPYYYLFTHIVTHIGEAEYYGQSSDILKTPLF